MMKLKTSIVSARSPLAVSQAAGVLRKGGVIIYPTETAYGIGTDATNRASISKVYTIKQRPRDKSLSVILSDISIAKKYVRCDKATLFIVKKLMPGPLTLISPKRKGAQTLAWRIPSGEFALKLARAFKKPITATSANISAHTPLYRAADVVREFSGKVDLIIDGGNLRKRRVSTIFDAQNKKVLRKGPISEKKILSALISRS